MPEDVQKELVQRGLADRDELTAHVCQLLDQLNTKALVFLELSTSARAENDGKEVPRTFSILRREWLNFFNLKKRELQAHLRLFLAIQLAREETHVFRRAVCGSNIKVPGDENEHQRSKSESPRRK